MVIFFAAPDVLSGIFTLVNFDEVEPNGVFVPFAAGCSTIVTHPYLEKSAKRPRAVLGMFDVSARPCVPDNTLTIAIPMNKFEKMVENMEDSFLTTKSWEKVRRRITLAQKKLCTNGVSSRQHEQMISVHTAYSFLLITF